MLFITIVVLATILAVWNLRTTSLPSSSDQVEAEKEIYSLLLTGLYTADGVPLAEYTTLGNLGYNDTSQEAFSRWDNQNPDLKQETFSNFLELNQQPYSIREYLPREISDQIIEQQGWWVSLSRIGFNSQLTQALVVRDRNMGCDSKGVCCYGEGSILFLQKKDNRWIIEDELTTWIGECTA